MAPALLLSVPDHARADKPDSSVLPPGVMPMKDAVVKVTPESKWNYLNPLDGKDPALSVPDFHKQWTVLTFDDSKWSTGAVALMGYGKFSGGGQEGEPATNIGLPESGKRYSAYFRHVFFVEKAGLYDVELVLVRDDAAIIYLNGKEEARSYEPGARAFAKAADAYELLVEGQRTAWTDGSDETAPHQHFLRGVQLAAGNNILAISLHNCLNPKAPTSSDLGMKVHYLAIAPPGSAPPPGTVSAKIVPQEKPAGQDAFEKISIGIAPWQMSAADIESNFSAHRLEWLDAAKQHAKVTVATAGKTGPTILDGRLPVLEANLDLAAGKLSRAQFVLHMRGGQPELTKETFAALLAKCKEALSARAGAPGKDRPSKDNPKSPSKLSATAWTGTNCLYLLESSVKREKTGEPFVAEFVRLTIVPAQGKDR